VEDVIGDWRREIVLYVVYFGKNVNVQNEMNAKEIWDMETKRDYRKFFTIPETADWMASLLDPKYHENILEPSAGDGALCKAVRKYNEDVWITAVELYPEWNAVLRKYADRVFIQDFLTFNKSERFSACIANPPFGNGINLRAHFDLMLHLVRRGGKLVILLPEDFFISFAHEVFSLENWGKNSDGTITPIKVVRFIKA
jgi:hypothetical protein